MMENMPATLRAAWGAACTARDAALAAPLIEPFAITNEWRVLVSRIDDAWTLAEKIAQCERAESAMRRRCMPGAATLGSVGPPVDFSDTRTPPPRSSAVARRAARRRDLFQGNVP